MIKEKQISETILATAKDRGPNKSTCPSEIARMLYPEKWRRYMEEVRSIAVQLRDQGKVLITQKGTVIETDNFKGPIRIKIVE